MKFSNTNLLLSASAVIATSPLIRGQAAPCPAPWVVHTVYSEGDQVTSYDHLSVQNQIYKCNPWPNDGYCGQAGFQPGQNEIGTATPAWTMAWTLVGPCSESPPAILPFDTTTTYYEAGELVTNQGKIWRCKSWPNTWRCMQDGYEPGVEYNGEPLYLEAWEEAIVPTASPSYKPSSSPSAPPSSKPSSSPSPSAAPSNAPSGSPSTNPSSSPSEKPSLSPSAFPSYKPSSSPSAAPSNAPSYKPSSSPSAGPSNAPSGSPSTNPSSSLSEKPSLSPSASPSYKPSSSPSAAPSNAPSYKPSSSPSAGPSYAPSGSPSTNPSSSPSEKPSLSPSAFPSYKPSSSPSAAPSNAPSASPSRNPSSSPSEKPSLSPSDISTAEPPCDWKIGMSYCLNGSDCDAYLSFITCPTSAAEGDTIGYFNGVTLFVFESKTSDTVTGSIYNGDVFYTLTLSADGSSFSDGEDNWTIAS